MSVPPPVTPVTIGTRTPVTIGTRTHETAGGERSHADLLSDCVHCGFCLSACPTYTLWGEEMDSPRGRIDLMRQTAADEPLAPSVVEHIDRCLGCMACVPACPSGVRYDLLIEDKRAEIEATVPRPLRDRLMRRLIFAIFPYRRRSAALTWPLRVYQRSGLQAAIRGSAAYRRMPARLRAMEAIAPPVPRPERIAERIPATSPRRATVGMLTGCVASTFFPGVNAATTRVLAAEGCDVVVPRRQGCCGALSAHNGRTEEARRFARALIDTFAREDVDAIVTNSAGCGSTMKEYADLLHDDPDYRAKAEEFVRRTRDVAEYLAELGPVATRHPLPVTVAYHDACHLANAQRITSQPRKLLSGVPGLTLTEIAEGNLCCGSAGIYNLLQPDAATALGDRKAKNVAATGAGLLVTANPGCLMQVTAALERAGTSIPTAHTVEVLDASIRGLGVETLTASSPGLPVSTPTGDV